MAPLELLRRLLALVLRLLNALLGVLGLGPVAFPASFPGGGRGGDGGDRPRSPGGPCASAGWTGEGDLGLQVEAEGTEGAAASPCG